jgi:hypothetical protein
MKHPYLWDRSGEPDPDIEKLERTLGTLQWEPVPMAGRRRPVTVGARVLAAAAMLVVLIAGTWFWMSRQRRESSWESAEGRVRLGETLSTGESSAMVLHADEVGRVEIRPRSVVRVLESSAGREQLELRRGTIHALIWAPPARFQVDTQSSRVVDLGCQYTLSVDAQGAGILEVETGWVAFEYKRLESFVPAGAACRTAPGRGPGVPFFRDAPASLISGVAGWETNGAGSELQHILESARSRDALTLWHLLPRVAPPERDQVYTRLAGLVDLSGVDRRRALQLDQKALDKAWDALQLENVEWWREWKRRW